MQTETTNLLPRADYEAELARIKGLAIAATAAYPQYDGYFDGWELVEVRNVKGLRARARRYWEPLPYLTIGKPSISEPGDVSVWHIGHGWVCSIGLANVEFIETDPAEGAGPGSAEPVGFEMNTW